MKAILCVTFASVSFAVTGMGAQLDRWETVSLQSPPNLTLYDVTYGAGTFVAVGETHSVGTGAVAEIFISPDGARWTRLSPAGLHGTLFDVAYGAGGFVIVGIAHVGIEPVDLILTSADGSNWTRRVAGIPNGLFAISYDHGGFVAAGLRGAIITSDDGLVWSNRSLPSDPALVLRGVAFGGGNHVAVGSTIIPYQGVVVASADRVQWSRHNLATSALRDVAYGNDRFVVVGENDTILRSSDAVTWTAGSSSVNGHLLDIMFRDGMFIAVGYPGTVMSSADGATWHVHRQGLELLYGIAYGNGRYVAIDYQGTILRTGPPNRPPIAVAQVSPAAEFFSVPPQYVIISPNDEDAAVTFNGAASSDPDGDFLGFQWLQLEPDGSTVDFSHHQETMLVLPLGQHDFILRVSDGSDETSTDFEVQVISASRAVSIVIALVEISPISNLERQPLLSMLRSAQRAFESGQPESGLHHLARLTKGSTRGSWARIQNWLSRCFAR